MQGSRYPRRAVLTGLIDFRTGFWGTPKPFVQVRYEYGNMHPCRPGASIAEREKHETEVTAVEMSFRRMKNDDILPLHIAQKGCTP